MSSLKPLIMITFFEGFVVSFETVLSEDIEEPINKFIVLRKAFLAWDVYSGQRVECFDLNELVPV